MHYFCTGECGGESDHPMNCGADGCSMKDKPMKACDCKDGKHHKEEPKD